MLYLDKAQTRMSKIDERSVNCDETTTPKKATEKLGEEYVDLITGKIRQKLASLDVNIIPE
jgi:hypothetical protein